MPCDWEQMGLCVLWIPIAEGLFASQVERAADCSRKNGLHSGATMAHSALGGERSSQPRYIFRCVLKHLMGPYRAATPSFLPLHLNGNWQPMACLLHKALAFPKPKRKASPIILKAIPMRQLLICGVYREKPSKVKSVTVRNKTNAKNRTELARLVVAAHVPLID